MYLFFTIPTMVSKMIASCSSPHLSVHTFFSFSHASFAFFPCLSASILDPMHIPLTFIVLIHYLELILSLDALHSLIIILFVMLSCFTLLACLILLKLTFISSYFLSSAPCFITMCSLLDILVPFRFAQ